MPTFGMLQRNPFIRMVLIANVFSQLGIWIRNFAILFYVMERTGGDAFAVSMISVAEYAPIFLFSLIGGVLADRWRPKKTIIWSELASALSVGVVLFALESGMWAAVFFATCCSAVLSQITQPAGMKLFKLHVPAEQAQAGMSLLQTVFSIFMVLGPILGTIAYQALGIYLSILLTGIAFLFSACAMVFIPPDNQAGAGERGMQTSVMQDMVDGIRYVAAKKVLVSLNLCFLAVGLGVGLISPLGIFLVTERLGLSAQDLQWMTIPYGVGEIIGGLLTFRLAAKIAPQRFLMLGLAVNAAGIILSGLSTVLWLTMAVQFLIALLQPAIFIGNNALVMMHTEQAYIGRVTGIRTPLMTGSMVVMMSVSGIAARMLPLELIYGAAGICFLLAALIVLPFCKARPATANREDGRAASAPCRSRE
ncbi:MFS transporter [Brevibacillus borstelensis]|uniref:MFS transporter n=1 Tax=Brevibacillus borstelensis TaxID=45462 RepID=UPI0030FB09AD